MKLFLCFCLSLIHCLDAYKIVTLPKPDEEISLKVYFSTKVVSHFHTVTSTVTKTNFATCYAAEPGIVDCQNKRDNEESEPKVELNGEAASWESIISPSRTERVARQLEEEEIVEIVEASENVQVIQPDLGEPAAVVYPTIVHQSREDEFVLDEQKLEVPAFEDEEIEARTDKAEVRHHKHDEDEHDEDEHEDGEHKEDEHKEDEYDEDEHKEDEHEEDEHEQDEHEQDEHEQDEHEQVSDDNSDSELEDENQVLDDEPEPEVSDESNTLEPETYTYEPETYTFEPKTYNEEPEDTTVIEDFEEANPARESSDGPIIELESSWEEKEVVIKQNVNTKCMEMKNNNLFMNVMSTIISTITEYEYTTVSGLNSVLFKSEGGCLPSDVNEMFSSSCV